MTPEYIYVNLLFSSRVASSGFRFKNRSCILEEFFLPIVNVINMDVIFFSDLADGSIILKQLSENKRIAEEKKQVFSEKDSTA